MSVYRVLRGFSYFNSRDLRTTYRYMYGSGFRSGELGFRIVVMFKGRKP